jgi:RpiR family carbohydrate utilization transcriptional regulator
MVSRLLHLMIIDIVATCVALCESAQTAAMLKEMKSNLSNKRYA